MDTPVSAEKVIYEAFDVMGVVGEVSLNYLHRERENWIYRGLSKHQEDSSTPVTKVKKMILIFWDLLGANLVKHSFHAVHINYW